MMIALSLMKFPKAHFSRIVTCNGCCIDLTYWNCICGRQWWLHFPQAHFSRIVTCNSWCIDLTYWNCICGRQWWLHCPQKKIAKSHFSRIVTCNICCIDLTYWNCICGRQWWLHCPKKKSPSPFQQDCDLLRLLYWLDILELHLWKTMMIALTQKKFPKPISAGLWLATVAVRYKGLRTAVALSTASRSVMLSCRSIVITDVGLHCEVPQCKTVIVRYTEQPRLLMRQKLYRSESIAAFI